MPDEYYNSIYTGEEIDRRLGLAGDVADAVYFDANDVSLWAAGAIASSTGANSSSTTRIRTTGYIGAGVKKISVAAGYKYMVFGYSSGTYMGTWNGSSFVKSGNWRTADLDLSLLPAYDLRLVMATSPTDSSISTDAASNITLTAALTDSGRAADMTYTYGQLQRIIEGLFVANLDTSLITTISSETQNDANSLTTPGTYRFPNLTAVRATANMPVSAAGKLFVYSTATTSYKVQVYTSNGGVVFTRSLNNGTWSGWRLNSEVLRAPIDGSDATDIISRRLSQEGACHLSAGTFKIHSLNIPANYLLEGIGDRTVLQLDSEYPNDPALILNAGCKVRNLKIIGAGGEAYDASAGSTIGTSHGISVDGISGTDLTNRLRIVIDGVEIAGFTGAGIYLNNTGGNIGDNVAVSNCNVHNCHAGIYTKVSEYHRITNSSFNGCYYGAYNDGGNNLFSNCGFNSCQIGCYIENLDGSASNNSHGTFSACTFNHEHDIAIKIAGTGDNYVSSGEVFVGCQIAYGGVDVNNGIGIHFDSCNFLNSSPITVGDGGFTLFSGCIFINATQSPVTKTGTGVLIFDGCYLRSGAAFNPI